MTSQRTYKPKIDVDDATAELRANAGTQFDPMIVELLCEVIEEDRAAVVRGEGGSEDEGAELGSDLVPAPVPSANGNGHGLHEEATAEHPELDAAP